MSFYWLKIVGKNIDDKSKTGNITRSPEHELRKSEQKSKKTPID